MTRMKTMGPALLLATALAVSASAQGDPEAGFAPLFNGRDLSGWEEAEGFVVEDGSILTRGSGAGDLFTTTQFGNAILRFDYMLSEAGNSGVFVRAETERPLDAGFEVQLLAPRTPYRDDLHCTGSLYGHVPVVSRPDESTGIWHSMEIVLDRDTVIVSVDGKAVTWAQTSRVESLKDKNVRGRIAFQGNHSDPEQWVRFRNVRLRNLDAEPDYVLGGLRRADPATRKAAYEAAVTLGNEVVPGLCRAMAAGDPVSPATAKQTLFAIVARASAPDSPASDREALGALLESEQSQAESPEVASYLAWLRGILPTD